MDEPSNRTTTCSSSNMNEWMDGYGRTLLFGSAACATYLAKTFSDNILQLKPAPSGDRPRQFYDLMYPGVAFQRSWFTVRENSPG